MNTGFAHIDSMQDEAAAQQTLDKLLVMYHSLVEYSEDDVPLAMLRQLENNPFGEYEEKDMDALRLSIKQDPDFFKARPILVNTYEGREGVIVAGNKRHRAAQLEGWEKIRCKFIKVPIDKEKVWAIRDNKHNGRWDQMMLKDEIVNLEDNYGVDISNLGFTSLELVDIKNFEPVATDQSPGTNTDPNYQGTAKSKDIKVSCPQCDHEFKVNKKGQVLVEE